MIKIPNENKIFSQTNSSDLFGNIWYTKNMNFDEAGYVKLSSRSFLMLSEETDGNFEFPFNFGRQSQGFHMVTGDNAYDMELYDSSFSITEDTSSNNPALTFDSAGIWFQNRWHATTTTKIWYETSTGSGWTDTGATLTSGKAHPMEVFRNKNSLAVGAGGNTVKLLDTTYATTVTLTIPADFEIIGMSYNNAKMAVATRMSDTAEGQNQEAYLFIWDGASSSAGQGFGVGSDAIFGICAYKSTWLILTRAGELKYFNGGGFETLASLPFYFTPATWGSATNRETYGDTMVVEGDVVYLNLSNDINIIAKEGEEYMSNYPAGIWCFDPKVGLYHRYSNSMSLANMLTVTSANVNTTTDILTKTAGTVYATGTPVKYVYDPVTQITGLIAGRVYYTIKHTSTTFSLAETYEDAINGVKINLTGTGAASNYFVALNLVDYACVKSSRTGGVALVETALEVADHLVFGSEIMDINSTNNYGVLNVTISGFDNIGYFVTSKISSANLEDNFSKVYLKYRPLKDTDKIIVKYKDVEIFGLPTSVPKNTSTTTCTWTDDATLTTTADLSIAKAYFDVSSKNELEVEILSGAGAGQMVQITGIALAGSTYTISLAESIRGVAVSDRCDILIDNWKLLKTTKDESFIDSSNSKGWEEFPLNISSKSIKFKVQLRGSETTIEEFQLVNKTQLPT